MSGRHFAIDFPIREVIVATCNEYASYMLRLWRIDTPGSPTEAAWQGEIQHIQSGHRWTFANLEALLDFLREQTHPRDTQMNPGSDDWGAANKKKS